MTLALEDRYFISNGPSVHRINPAAAPHRFYIEEGKPYNVVRVDETGDLHDDLVATRTGPDLLITLLDGRAVSLQKGYFVKKVADGAASPDYQKALLAKATEQPEYQEAVADLKSDPNYHGGPLIELPKDASGKKVAGGANARGGEKDGGFVTYV